MKQCAKTVAGGSCTRLPLRYPEDDTLLPCKTKRLRRGAVSEEFGEDIHAQRDSPADSSSAFSCSLPFRNSVRPRKRREHGSSNIQQRLLRGTGDSQEVYLRWAGRLAQIRLE